MGMGDMNPLAGKPLRYLIGADDPGHGADDVITEVPYGNPIVIRGISIGYCNLFDEENTGTHGPYLSDSDTAKEYDEGQIDPRGKGWIDNLAEQFMKRRHQGFEYIELDNPDAYSIKDVIGAIDLAAQYGLRVIAKNPGLLERGGLQYIGHPSVYGIIIEKGAGGVASMQALRVQVGKSDLPIWFVAFGSGRSWAMGVAHAAVGFHNIGVTYSQYGEYGSSEDILKPQLSKA